MRAALLSAENVRASLSALHQQHAFDSASLADRLHTGEYRQSVMYRTVPVVAAWNAIDAVAAQEGFEFRIPKARPRNPANQPTAEEATILAQLERTGQAEYFRADRASNSILLARPIRLTADCLACHGDPADSPTHDGKDILGFPMEGWKEGEIHGAFVLKANLDQIDKVASAKTQSQARGATLLLLLPAALALAGGAFWYSRRSIVGPLLDVIRRTRHSSAETLSVSAQMAATSHSLAASSTEQAASLQEISSSLGNISRGTRGAAESALQA
jgi:methyl-accepting chemotaxis protein